MCHQVFESAVRLFRRAEADVLAHRPEPRAVHVRVDAARERVLAGAPDVALEVDVGEVLGTVDRLDREAPVRSYVLHVSLASFVNAATMSGSGVPIGNTRATPSFRSSSTSRGGMMPPTTTLTSAAPCARSPSSTRRERSTWAPDSTESPTTSTSSWIAARTISSGVRLSPE